MTSPPTKKNLSSVGRNVSRFIKTHSFEKNEASKKKPRGGVGGVVVELSYLRNDPHASDKYHKTTYFYKQLRLRPIELRFCLVGGLFNRTLIPTLLGPTERISKTRKIWILRVIFRIILVSKR